MDISYETKSLSDYKTTFASKHSIFLAHIFLFNDYLKYTASRANTSVDSDDLKNMNSLNNTGDERIATQTFSAGGERVCVQLIPMLEIMRTSCQYCAPTMRTRMSVSTLSSIACSNKSKQFSFSSCASCNSYPILVEFY